MRRDLKPLVEEGRVDAALEPRVRASLVSVEFLTLSARCRRGRNRRTRSGRRSFPPSSPIRCPAHDAADVVDVGVVGDDRHRGVERIGPAVQARRPSRRRRALRADQLAGQLRPVVDVQGTPEVEHDEVGDVDQAPRSAAARPRSACAPTTECDGPLTTPPTAAREERRAAGGVVGSHIGTGT